MEPLAPISIRMALFEVEAIHEILQEARMICERPDIRIETIVLADFYDVWRKKLLAAWCRPKTSKDPVYKIPISVARILHYRILHTYQSQAKQFVLAKLDEALLNRNFRPPIIRQIN